MPRDPIREFEVECEERVAANPADEALSVATRDFVSASVDAKYTYNFTWLGRPIVQYPQDIVAIQELIWKLQPDLIVETGIAHGGSLILSASILELIGKGEVLGIDVDIRDHNRREIEAHPLFRRIRMIEGSSVDPAIVEQVRKAAEGCAQVMVILDSNHTHDHVAAELAAYAPLVTRGSYLIVMDTVIEEMPAGSYPDRPWDKGDNPWTAVQEFLAGDSNFEIDASIPNKLMVTMGRDGFLRRIR